MGRPSSSLQPSSPRVTCRVLDEFDSACNRHGRCDKTSARGLRRRAKPGRLKDVTAELAYSDVKQVLEAVLATDSVLADAVGLAPDES
jgi:hypothetical protein